VRRGRWPGQTLPFLPGHLWLQAPFVLWAAGLDAEQIIEYLSKVWEVIGFVVAPYGRTTAKTLVSGFTGRT
jgi:hypothetical protein